MKNLIVFTFLLSLSSVTNCLAFGEEPSDSNSNSGFFNEPPSTFNSEPIKNNNTTSNEKSKSQNNNSSTDYGRTNITLTLLQTNVVYPLDANGKKLITNTINGSVGVLDPSVTLPTFDITVSNNSDFIIWYTDKNAASNGWANYCKVNVDKNGNLTKSSSSTQLEIPKDVLATDRDGFQNNPNINTSQNVCTNLQISGTSVKFLSQSPTVMPNSNFVTVAPSPKTIVYFKDSNGNDVTIGSLTDNTTVEPKAIYLPKDSNTKELIIWSTSNNIPFQNVSTKDNAKESSESKATQDYIKKAFNNKSYSESGWATYCAITISDDNKWSIADGYLNKELTIPNELSNIAGFSPNSNIATSVSHCEMLGGVNTAVLGTSQDLNSPMSGSQVKQKNPNTGNDEIVPAKGSIGLAPGSGVSIYIEDINNNPLLDNDGVLITNNTYGVIPDNSQNEPVTLPNRSVVITKNMDNQNSITPITVWATAYGYKKQGHVNYCTVNVNLDGTWSIANTDYMTNVSKIPDRVKTAFNIDLSNSENFNVYQHCDFLGDSKSAGLAPGSTILTPWIPKLNDEQTTAKGHDLDFKNTGAQVATRKSFGYGLYIAKAKLNTKKQPVITGIFTFVPEPPPNDSLNKFWRWQEIDFEYVPYSLSPQKEELMCESGFKNCNPYRTDGINPYPSLRAGKISGEYSKDYIAKAIGRIAEDQIKATTQKAGTTSDFSGFNLWQDLVNSTKTSNNPSDYYQYAGKENGATNADNTNVWGFPVTLPMRPTSDMLSSIALNVFRMPTGTLNRADSKLNINTSFIPVLQKTEKSNDDNSDTTKLLGSGFNMTNEQYAFSSDYEPYNQYYYYIIDWQKDSISFYINTESEGTNISNKKSIKTLSVNDYPGIAQMGPQLYNQSTKLDWEQKFTPNDPNQQIIDIYKPDGTLIKDSENFNIGKAQFMFNMWMSPDWGGIPNVYPNKDFETTYTYLQSMSFKPNDDGFNNGEAFTVDFTSWSKSNWWTNLRKDFYIIQPKDNTKSILAVDFNTSEKALELAMLNTESRTDKRKNQSIFSLAPSENAVAILHDDNDNVFAQARDGLLDYFKIDSNSDKTLTLSILGLYENKNQDKDNTIEIFKTSCKLRFTTGKNVEKVNDKSPGCQTVQFTSKQESIKNKNSLDNKIDTTKNMVIIGVGRPDKNSSSPVNGNKENKPKSASGTITIDPPGGSNSVSVYNGSSPVTVGPEATSLSVNSGDNLKITVTNKDDSSKTATCNFTVSSITKNKKGIIQAPKSCGFNYSLQQDNSSLDVKAINESNDKKKSSASKGTITIVPGNANVTVKINTGNNQKVSGTTTYNVSKNDTISLTVNVTSDSGSDSATCMYKVTGIEGNKGVLSTTTNNCRIITANTSGTLTIDTKLAPKPLTPKPKFNLNIAKSSSVTAVISLDGVIQPADITRLNVKEGSNISLHVIVDSITADCDYTVTDITDITSDTQNCAIKTNLTDGEFNIIGIKPYIQIVKGIIGTTLNVKVNDNKPTTIHTSPITLSASVGDKIIISKEDNKDNKSTPVSLCTYKVSAIKDNKGILTKDSDDCKLITNSDPSFIAIGGISE